MSPQNGLPHHITPAGETPKWPDRKRPKKKKTFPKFWTPKKTPPNRNNIPKIPETPVFGICLYFLGVFSGDSGISGRGIFGIFHGNAGPGPAILGLLGSLWQAGLSQP